MNEKRCIVVIEDEITVQQSLIDNLSKNGFEVYAYDSAEQGLDSGMINVSDAVIMDIGLPGMDGWEATAQIKKADASLPVIMLTAYNDLTYRMQGFETGADDYIIKPFFMEELLARIKAVLKRTEMLPGKKSHYDVGDLAIDVKAKTVVRNGQTIRLSLTEFNLLVLLAEEHGNPVSKEEIMQKVWKGRYTVGDNTIEVYINLLRNKIDRPFTSKLIHTKPGFGYYLAIQN